MGSKAGFIAFFGDKEWLRGSPCPNCEHPAEVHSETSRMVGCQVNPKDNVHDGDACICGCRRLRYENAADQDKLPGENCPKCHGTGIDRKGRLCGYHMPAPELLRRSCVAAMTERDAARADVRRLREEKAMEHAATRRCWHKDGDPFPPSERCPDCSALAAEGWRPG